VLFSEPKIPQLRHSFLFASRGRSFSALQRAENSSISKISRHDTSPYGFSALQRAENSSILLPSNPDQANGRFQCSSASRKFLNFEAAEPEDLAVVRFSALQRAENSSISHARTAF